MNINRIKNAENLINLELNAMQNVIDLYPKVIEVIKKFEGKQANKRLDTALKQIDKNIYFYIKYNSFIIKHYIENRSCKSSEGEGWIYIHNSYENIVHCCVSSSGYNIETALKNDRIDSKVIIEEIKKTVERNQKYILETKEGLKNIDNYFKDKTEIETKITEYNNKIPYLIDNYFNFRINVG